MGAEVTLEGEAQPSSQPMPNITVYANGGGAGGSTQPWYRRWEVVAAIAVAVVVLGVLWCTQGTDRSCTRSLMVSAARYSTSATQNKSAALALRDLSMARGLVEAARSVGGSDKEIGSTTGIDVVSFTAFMDAKEGDIMKKLAPTDNVIRKSPYSAAAGWK